MSSSIANIPVRPWLRFKSRSSFACWNVSPLVTITSSSLWPKIVTLHVNGTARTSLEWERSGFCRNRRAVQFARRSQSFSISWGSPTYGRLPAKIASATIVPVIPRQARSTSEICSGVRFRWASLRRGGRSCCSGIYARLDGGLERKTPAGEGNLDHGRSLSSQRGRRNTRQQNCTPRSLQLPDYRTYEQQLKTGGTSHADTLSRESRGERFPPAPLETPPGEDSAGYAA